MKVKKTILIIGNESSDREIEKICLEEAGYVVLEAEDAKEGFSIAQGKKPDRIVLNHQLPQINGGQFIRKLKRDPKIKGTPCIIVTDPNNEDQIDKSCGVSGIVFKPISTKLFKLMVGQSR